LIPFDSDPSVEIETLGYSRSVPPGRAQSVFASFGPKTLRPALAICAALAASMPSLRADPQLTSWYTFESGKYARIYETTADQTSGNAVTTWSRNGSAQSLPAYSGVQEVDYSTNWIYVRSTGLGFHVMGPWYLDAAKTQLFPNFPTNQHLLYRIPRTPTVPATKTINGGGAIGCFVDGVAMYNSWDAYYWNGSADVNGEVTPGSPGLWNRDAYVNEGLTFDPANAHQPQSDQYHYHANPPALRYLLGDGVSYNAATDTYSENPTNLRHSPILGWVSDGYPIYGPYGYSNPTNAGSGVRRMVSGYVLRNGGNGTVNLTLTGRTTLPAWAARAYNQSTNLSSSQYGPSVSSSYPLGRYMEDNDYLGDLGQTQGVNFDLDEYNGRFCITPDFPHGTYAYFVCIASNGTPVFPYNIAVQYYGSPTGASVTSISEAVVTNFTGGPNAPLQLAAPAVNAKNSTVTLAWSSVEGGTYQILSSTNLSTWSNQATNIPSQGITTTTNFTGNSKAGFYRAVRTALAAYDPVTSGSGGSGILNVSPTSGSRGTTFTLTIYLNSNAQPSPPPQNAPINSVMVGTITGTSDVHVSQTQVTSSITIPSNASTGAQTVSVTFPGPPNDPTNTVTYTLAGGFTIQ
jgi:hypothetical protein